MWVKFKSNRHCQITLSGAAYDMIVLSRGPLLPLHIKLTNVTRGNFLHGLVDFTGCPKKGGISVLGSNSYVEDKRPPLEFNFTYWGGGGLSPLYNLYTPVYTIAAVMQPSSSFS